MSHQERPRARKRSTVRSLHERGFDLSYAIPFERAWQVRCSQCEAVCVNGVPCHERGCPNIPSDADTEDET